MKFLMLGLCSLMLATLPLQAQKMDVAVSVGTDGVGVDLGTHIGSWVGIRTGLSYVPKFEYKMSFGVQLDDGDGSSSEDPNSRFNKLASKLHDMTGIVVDDHVDMVGRPSFASFKFLVDIYPFVNDRRWFVTAGFYVGSSTVAKAVNADYEISTLMGVGIYNGMYDKAANDEPVISVGNLDLYMPQFLEYGRMGVNVGTYADGSNYFMEPDQNSLVSARVKVNRLKPYLGVGFGDWFTKAKKCHYSVDCGAMFWGGTPAIVTHDGTDLAKLSSVRGRPGDYVDVIKKFKVYPVVTFRVSCPVL